MPSFKSIVVSSAVAMLPLAAQALDETTYPYEAPGATDSRSPCPGLNALANHGILPRDGKNIDMATLIKAAYTGYSLSEGATQVVGGVGLKASTTGDASTFNLGDLAQHDPQVIEHDGSMTREDAYFGDALSFNETAWQRTLANWGDNEIISYAVAAAERTARFEYGAANNPEFNATFANQGSLLEYALALSAFGSVTSGDGNKTLIVYLFENERLPLSLGWQPPTENITVASAQAIAGEIGALL